MGKLTTYLMIMTGIMLLMYFGGVIPASPLLNLVLDPMTLDDITAPLLFKILAAVAAVTIAVSVAVGIFGGGSSKAELAGLWILGLFILNLGFDFLNVYQVIAGLGDGYKIIALLLFAPFMLLWALTVVEWWRGLTT